MGALTSYKHSFSQRSWEPFTFLEIDDTNVLPERLRVEKLKTIRTRYLPVRHWMADLSRFRQSFFETSHFFSFPLNKKLAFFCFFSL